MEHWLSRFGAQIAIEAFCEQDEPATYPDQRASFGAGMNYPSLFSLLQVGPYRLRSLARLAMAVETERPNGKTS